MVAAGTVYPVLLRFWFGLAGSAAAGLVVFRLGIFVPGSPEFQCLTIGALAAAVLALVRASRPGQAVVLGVLFGLVHLGLARLDGWGVAVTTALGGVLMGLGLVLIAGIFDLLARDGYRFGKFLVFGPLLGGLYLAVTPIVQFFALTSTGALSVLWFNLFLGVLIGGGVGLGAELAELLTEPAPAGPTDAGALGRGS